jgi:hypothetical protein
MAEYTVFYSWQTDTPDECGKGFIREALNAAITKLSLDIDVEEAPRVDSGMEGVAGSPDVATVMFDKITESSIFLGDMTLVGEIKSHGSDSASVKRTPNPNVAIEMGLAAGILGWERIICVMNEAIAPREEMPFDMRNRRFPIDFELSQEDAAVSEIRDRQSKDLTKWICKAIKVVEANELRKVDRSVQLLDVRCLNLMLMHRSNDFFSVPESGQNPFIDPDKFNTAAIRLIELGLLRADVTDEGKYAYHWTYLGQKVMDATVRKFSS